MSVEAVASPPGALLLSIEDIANLTGLSVPTLYRYRSAGKLPQPIRLTKGAVRWRAADVHLWVHLGCPDQATFEAQRAAQAGTRRTG